jgi:hypothetical protein
MILLRCVKQYNFYLPFPATPVVLLCTPATKTLSVAEDVAWVAITLANDQPDAQIFIHLLKSSTHTCFEQYLAHPQEVRLY